MHVVRSRSADTPPSNSLNLIPGAGPSIQQAQSTAAAFSLNELDTVARDLEHRAAVINQGALVVREDSELSAESQIVESSWGIDEGVSYEVMVGGAEDMCMSVDKAGIIDSDSEPEELEVCFRPQSGRHESQWS